VPAAGAAAGLPAVASAEAGVRAETILSRLGKAFQGRSAAAAKAAT
jgi:hypothetical protein